MHPPYQVRSPREQVASSYFMLRNHGQWCVLDPKESGLPKGTRCCQAFYNASALDATSSDISSHDEHRAERQGLEAWLDW